MKAFKKVTNKISNSKIIKNPIFLVIGLIAIILVIALIYFIFLKYSPIMNFKYEGYAISGKEITENLLGSSEDSNKNKNLELTKIEEQGTIFKKLNDYFVGSKEKTEINLNYPIYINNNSAIYNLAESSTLISKDFEQVTGYPNLSISEGKVYDGNNLERADAKEYIFVKTTDEIYINLYEIQIKTTANEYTIPVNSILAFTENSIRYYTVNNNVLVFNQINDVDNNSNVQMVENNYTYEELLTRLGILQDETNNNGNNETQTNIIQEDITNSKTEEKQENEVKQEESIETNTNDEQQTQNGYIKPEVSVEDFIPEVYTAKSVLTIKDPAGRIVEAPTFEIYKDNKIYLRRTYTNSGNITVTGLVPETEYKIVGKYVYLNENGQKVENTFYEESFTTKGYEELGSIDIQKENGEIFSNKIQLTKVKITSDLNAEVIKGISQVEIETGDIRTVLKNNQVNSLLRGEEITIESSDGLKSDSKINYIIKFYDKNGIELKVNNNTGETRTSKEKPIARVSIKEQDIVSVTLRLNLTNKDNVELENYKYIVTRPNGEKVKEERLAENEKEILLNDLDQNQYYKISIYTDYDLNDNKGKQEKVEIGNLVFATQPISTLGSLELIVENKELTSTTSMISYKINEDRTDKRLIQILNELTIKIVEQPSNNEDKTNSNNNQGQKEGIVVYTDILSGEEIENLQQAGTKEIKYENLKSNTTYTIEIIGKVQLGNTQEEIPITYNYKEFTTLKIPAKVEIRNQFVTGNLIDFDVMIEDINNSVLNNKVRMELRNSSNDLIDLQELTTNEDYIRKTYEKLEENQTYRLSFYADQYNEGNTDETYKVNYLLKEIEIVTEPGISGSIGLTELSRKATGKNLVDMSSETKWYVYPNFNTNDYYGKEYNAETKTLTLGGHGNWRRAVYDLREYAGQEVTMSFKARQVDNNYSTAYIQNSKTDTNRTKIEGLTEEWKDFQYTLTVDSTGYLGFYVQYNDGIEIQELQVELGNKKTSYEEFKYTLESRYSINLEDRRDEITTNDYYIKIYEDNNLVKEDRYEEIPEENVITNEIKTYETQAGKKYKVELVIKLRDREYVLSELEYNTQDTEEIKGIYNKDDFLEIQPRGNYIVLGDIDLRERYQFGNINFPFEGKINFNGKKLVVSNDQLCVFYIISEKAIIENLVYDVQLVNTANVFGGFVYINYGEISNVQINLYAKEDLATNRTKVARYFMDRNAGTLNKFVINIKNELNFIRSFAAISINEGEIKNGYIVGNKINSNYDIEQNVWKDIGVLCYRVSATGRVKNVYSTIDIELSDGNYYKNVSPLIASIDTYSVNIENIYSTGNITNSNKNYGINVSSIGTNNKYKITNSYYMSDDIYNVDYDNKTTKLALYDTEFQKKMLNEENSFEIEENINNGYYPQLVLNDCMPAQEYVKLPEVVDADLPDIIYTEVLEQTSSTAKVKFRVNNPSAETITNIKIQNLDCTIESQEYSEGKSEVIAILSNPILSVSEYSVMSISTQGAFNKEYTRTFSNGERILQLDMYKEVRTIEEWNGINKSLSENYILMNDLDFMNNGNMATINGTYTGKINGNNYTIKNIQNTTGRLISTISNTGKVLNLNIKNYQSTASYADVIATLNGELNNVHIEDVKLEKTLDSNDNQMGGLVALSYGNIYNSSVSNLEIRNYTLSTNTRVGGLVGIANSGNIENCYVQNAKLVVKENYSYNGIGGLVGIVQDGKTNIKNCYVTGTIETDGLVGGIIGSFGSGDISNCYSMMNIYTENNVVGGIAGITNSGSAVIAQNNLFLGSIYNTGTDDNTDAICPNKDMDNNYIYEGVTVNGYLVENSKNVVTREELKLKDTYLNKIGLGLSFSYKEVENGELPLLYERGTTELLPNQEKILIPEKTEIYIENIEAEKSNINEMQAILTINNPLGKQIANVVIDNMNITTKSIVNKNGKTYITLSANPTGFYDSYKVSGIEYIDDEDKKSISTEAKIELKFYKELYNVQDWQAIEMGTYQNYRLMNDIDFNNMPNIKCNVTMKELITNNDEQYTLKNIKLDFSEGNSGLIRKVDAIKNINFENIEIENSTSNSKIAIIVAGEQINKCNFTNISITANKADYIGCIFTTTDNMDNISLNNINIIGKNYVGSLCPNLGHVVQNVSATDIYVEGTNYIGGIAGNLTGIIHTGSMVNINVTGSQYIGGIAGYSNRATNDSIYNCAVSDSNISGKTYVGGLVGSGMVYSSQITNSEIYGNNYVGGIAGLLQNSLEQGNYVENVEINGIYDRVGGIAGQINDANFVRNSVKNSSIKGRNYVGGIAGYNLDGSNMINIFYNAVEGTEIKGSEQYVGGIIGYAVSNIYCNYSINSTVIGKTSVGGLIGEFRNGSVYANYTNNTVIAEENAGGLLGNLDNARMTDQVYISSVFYNYVANFNISGNRNIGGLIGNIAQVLYSRDYYYSNYAQVDLNSTDENTVSLGIGGMQNQNQYLKDTYYYKYSTINGENPNAQNEIFISSDKYLVEDDLKLETTYRSKIKWNTSNWNYNVLKDDKYPVLSTTTDLTEQVGIDLPVDSEHIVGNVETTDSTGNSIETQSISEEPEQIFEYSNKEIQTYSTYSVITAEDGSQAIRNSKLYVKDNNLYAIPSTLSESANSNGSIVPVANNLILDSYNGKEYETILGSDGKIYDLKEPIEYPENFVNSEIESIGNNLNNDSHEVEVLYKNGDKIKFNYQTGEVIFSSEEDAEKTGLFDYLKNKISEIGNSNSDVSQEIVSKYEESKELQEKLEKTSVEEAIERQSNYTQAEKGVTTTENNATNNSLKENKYISMYNEETGQYEIYNEEELLDTSKEEVVSENEKIEANDLNEYYASEGKTRNTKMGIVWIVISIIGVGIILFVLGKKIVIRGRS